MPEPGLGLKISEPVHSDLKTEGEQIAVRLVDTNCELVRPDSDQNFYEIDVQVIFKDEPPVISIFLKLIIFIFFFSTGVFALLPSLTLMAYWSRESKNTAL